MNLITILEHNSVSDYRKHFSLYLPFEKLMVDRCFHWLKLRVKGGILYGEGNLKVADKNFPIVLCYSPFFEGRFDRIFIRDKSIRYSQDIHLYPDLSLCLYHPKVDKPLGKIIPLVTMIPWISEWCIHYEEWKKYGVWLGKEIKH